MISVFKIVLLVLPATVLCQKAFDRPKSGPEAIKKFYDRILDGGVEAASRNLTFLKEVFADDWNLRPNWLNPTGFGPNAGPFPEGMQKILGTLFSKVWKNMEVKRQHTLMCSDDTLCGTPVVVLSSLAATLGDLPEGFDEYPMFPGIDPAKIQGKRFKTLAIDIHVIKDGKISRSWHFEDYGTALAQVLNGDPVPRLFNPKVTPGQALNEVPTSIKNFYDKVLSDPMRGGQDDSLLAETMHRDWNVRPNPLNPTGKGPYREGFKSITESFGTFIPDTKFDRQHTLLCGDRVAVLSKLTGTINPPPRTESIPFFPGIPVDKIKGKRFESAALDIHVVKDGLTKQAWHIEDWANVLDQVYNDKPAADFGFYEEYL